MRLGDLDALHDHVMEEMLRNPHCGRIERIMHRHEHESFLRDIRLAPTIDAVLVVHGRWVDHMCRDWRCSECGEKIHKVRNVDGYCYDDKPNYCPNCGAKMKDGE